MTVCLRLCIPLSGLSRIIGKLRTVPDPNGKEHYKHLGTASPYNMTGLFDSWLARAPSAGICAASKALS